MDPDATLAQMQKLIDEGRTVLVYDHAVMLADWLRRDGFQPNWDAHPDAAEYMKNVLSVKEVDEL